jgi:hypothetical protein
VEVIQTTYNGVRYRSRTEARWAVFFEKAGIAVDYEPEGVKTAAGPYLPDFYARDLGVYFEVKGEQPTNQEVVLAKELEAVTRKPVFFLVGSPQEDSYLMQPGRAERGRLAKCHACPSREWWAVFELEWWAINPSNANCDGRPRDPTSAIQSARNERFGVHD